MLLAVNSASIAQRVEPAVLEFGAIAGNSNTGVHYSRGLSLRNDLHGEYLTLLSVTIRPPMEHGTGVVEPAVSLPVTIAPGDSISVAYRLIAAARSPFAYHDTIRFVVRRGDRGETETLLVPVAAMLTISDAPFGSSADRGTYSFCRCAGTRIDGAARAVAGGGLFLVNPGAEDLTLDSFRVAATPGVVVNDSIRVFDYAWSGSGPLPASSFRRPPVRIEAGTTANVLFQFLAAPSGPKAALVTYYLRRPSGDTLTVTSVATGSVIERASVLATPPQFPLQGVNQVRIPVGMVDSTTLSLSTFRCTVPDDAAVTIESVTFRRSGILTLLSRRPSEPMRALPVTIAECAGRVPETLDTGALEYRVRYAPTEPGVLTDTAVITYSYPTAGGVVRDSMYAFYYLEAEPSTKVERDVESAERLRALPNPVGGSVWLEGIPAPEGVMVTIEVYDAAGKRMATVPSTVRAGGRIFLELPTLGSGIFTLAVTSDGRPLGVARIVRSR